MRLLYLCALTAGAVTVTAYWLAQSSPLGVQSGVALVAWFASLGATLWAARQDQAGTLKCVAGVWTLDSRGLAISGGVTVLIDLQQLLIVTFTAHDGRKFWYCLHQRSEPAAWAALRRAVVSTSGRCERSASDVGRDTPI